MRRKYSVKISRRGPILALSLGGVVLIAAIAAATAIAVFASRDRAISSARRELESNAHLVARHYEYLLGDFAAMMRSAAAEIEIDRISAPDTFARMVSTAPMHRMLAAKVTGARELVGMNVWSADGRLLNSSNEWPVPNRSIAQRSYFQAFKSGKAQQPLQLELVTSQFVDGRALVFAHRMTSPNGDFLGLITRSLSPKSFEEFFALIAVDKNAAIALVHSDGTLIARYPRADHMVGVNVIHPKQYQRLSKSGMRTVWTPGLVDQSARFAAPAPIGGLPLTIVVSTTVEATLAEWREQTRLLVTVASLSALVICITLVLIIRQLQRQHAASRARLMLEKHRLDTAVNNLTHGLLLFDAEQRLLSINSR